MINEISAIVFTVTFSQFNIINSNNSYMKNHKYIKSKLLYVYNLKSPFDNRKILLCRYTSCFIKENSST